MKVIHSYVHFGIDWCIQNSGNFWLKWTPHIKWPFICKWYCVPLKLASSIGWYSCERYWYVILRKVFSWFFTEGSLADLHGFNQQIFRLRDYHRNKFIQQVRIFNDSFKLQSSRTWRYRRCTCIDISCSSWDESIEYLLIFFFSDPLHNVFFLTNFLHIP